MNFSRRRASKAGAAPVHGKLYARVLIFTADARRGALQLRLSGQAAALDQVLLTRGLQSKVGDFRYAHFNNDYYEREDPTDGH